MVVYDNLGAAHTLNVYFTNTGTTRGGNADYTWEVDVYDSADASASAASPIRRGPLATQTLTFSPPTAT